MNLTMKAVQIPLMVILGVVLFNGSVSHASEALDRDQQLFFNQFRYSVQAHDVNQLIRLTHTSSLECVSEEDWEYYYVKVLDSLATVLGKRQAIRRVTITEFAPGEINISKDLPSGNHVQWPVAPEARIFIHYEIQGQTTVASLYLAKDGERWKWVHICTP